MSYLYIASTRHRDRHTISVGRFSVRYWKEPEGGYGGQCTELPGAISQGETFEELKTNMEDAIRLTLEYREVSEHDNVGG